MLNTTRRPFLRHLSMYFSRDFKPEQPKGLNREKPQVTNDFGHKLPPKEMQSSVQYMLNNPSLFNLKKATINQEDLDRFNKETLEVLKHTSY